MIDFIDESFNVLNFSNTRVGTLIVATIYL